MNQAAAVIGAGKTGRGFIARLLQDSGAAVTFVDKNRDLVKLLQERGEFRVNFFGEKRPGVVITGYRAWPAGSSQAAATLSESDLVFVSVGRGSFPAVAAQVADALRARVRGGAERPCLLFTFENAVGAARELRSLVLAEMGPEGAALDDRCTFVECAVFCSTVEKKPGSLDILSEDLDEVPYDAGAYAGPVPIPSFTPEARFDILMKRKIYTYNCASAAIAYLGARRGYRVYSEAANDPAIAALLNRLYDEIEQALCREFGLDPSDQRRFAARSLAKFQDPSIVDTIERNARDVLRKLRPDDRLVGPARLMLKHGILPDALATVFAAALCYAAPSEEPLRALLEEKGAAGVLREISGIDPGSDFGHLILARLECGI